MSKQHFPQEDWWIGLYNKTNMVKMFVFFDKNVQIKTCVYKII